MWRSRGQAEVLARIEEADLVLHLLAQDGITRVTCRVVVLGDSFVLAAEHATSTDSGCPTAAVEEGPLADLIDALWAMVPAPARQFEDSHRDHESAPAVRAEDVPLLAALVREGDPEAMTIALDLADLPALPDWLREAAFGVDGLVTVVVTSTMAAQMRVYCHAHLSPSGWLAMGVDRGGLVRAHGWSGDDVRTSIITACTALVLAGATDTAA
ncbi:hypothetical protein [Luteipulveratus mongoliensis]|uniref:Uncharacterized protein n=1 Tax=Luteipulveratus mongoliensis TaxID=571913 RepID=A0A0K1JNL6_9MICO|nr:hypothetical protein [Luteipulveratus mongoliensis]AKU18309.1 hypothetical protein VV02_24795 [Luteipulveratus mongoliensis]